jgi:hypothetical protein
MKAGMNEDVDASVPIRIWGTDADGEVFRQSVNARDLSEQSALLDGIEHHLKAGDLLGLQYNGQKAHARVTWVQEANSDHNQLLTVELLERSKCPWTQKLSARPAARHEERRRFTRHRLAVGVELRTVNNGAPLHVRTSDMSGMGCYVETMFPLANGTKLDISIWLDSNKMLTTGVVRTCHIAFGMGIEFTGLTAQEGEILDLYLECRIKAENATNAEVNHSSTHPFVSESVH